MFLDPQFFTLAMADGLGGMALAYVIVAFIAHVMMGISVFGDADKLESKEVELFLFHPMMWGAIVFIFGIAGLAVYWAMHHSSLRDSRVSGDMSDSDEGSN